MTPKKLFWLSLCAAIAAHVLFLVVTAPNVVPTSQEHYDARQYRELADSLAAGDGFLLRRGDHRGPDLDRTPAYPLFVSLFGSGWDSVPPFVVIQHALVFVTALVAGAWARARIGEAYAAVFAFAIVALDLTTMTYASYLLTETLFTLLLVVALAAWPLRGDGNPTARSAVAGLAWGLATLTRPITFYLAPLTLGVALLGARRRPAVLRDAAVALLCGIVVVGAWMARNHALSGSAVLSTIEGENILHYRAALVSLPPGKTVEQWRRELRDATREGDYDRTDPRQAATLDAAKKKKAFELIASHPLGIYRPLALGLPRLYLSPNRSYLYKLLGVEHQEWDLDAVEDSPAWHRLLSREAFYLGASAAYQLLLLVGAGAGAFLAWRRREAWAIVPVVAILYLTVFSAGLETHARFRVPIVPILALLAARAAWVILERRLGPPSRAR